MRDRRKLFPRLTPPEEAIRVVKDRLPRGLRRAVKSIDAAVWHVTASDIAARVSYPREPRAIADGYAVRYECVAGAHEANPVRLPVIERVRVGEVPTRSIEGCEAVEVDTGATIPPGANAVVPVEYTREVAGIVEVYRSVGFGENIAWPGSDIVEGEIVVEKGYLLTPQLVGALAASGLDVVDVYEKPRVCIVPTGVELTPPGEELKPGHVYEVDSYVLDALLRLDGFPSTRHPIVPDDESIVGRVLASCLDSHDVVLFTGGTSAGPMDVVYRVIESEGELLVHGLKLKPGKPTALGIVKGRLVVGLPGNPVSALNVYNVVVRELLWHLAGGRPPRGPSTLKARLVSPVPVVKGRRLYQPVKLACCVSGVCAVPIPFESYMIVTYSRSDGYIVVPGEMHEMMPEGEEVVVEVFEGTSAEKPLCIGEEIVGVSECKQAIGGTALAVKALGYRINSIAVLSPNHPSFQSIRDKLEGCSTITRRLALIGPEEPNIVALPSPSTSLRHLLLQHIAGYKNAIPTRSSLMTGLLLKHGYAEAGIMLEEHAKRFGLEPRSIIEEELYVCRVRPGGGSSQP